MTNAVIAAAMATQALPGRLPLHTIKAAVTAEAAIVVCPNRAPRVFLGALPPSPSSRMTGCSSSSPAAPFSITRPLCALRLAAQRTAVPQPAARAQVSAMPAAPPIHSCTPVAVPPTAVARAALRPSRTCSRSRKRRSLSRISSSIVHLSSGRPGRLQKPVDPGSCGALPGFCWAASPSGIGRGAGVGHSASDQRCPRFAAVRSVWMTIPWGRPGLSFHRITVSMTSTVVGLCSSSSRPPAASWSWDFASAVVRSPGSVRPGHACRA